MELIDAAVSNDYDEVKRLLESGADPDVQSNLEDDLGFTALMWAASNNNERMVDLLLYYNANPFLSNIDGDTAEDLADYSSRFSGLADKIDKGMYYYLNKNTAKQSLALANSRIARLSDNTPLKYLDNDAFDKILEYFNYPYSQDVSYYENPKYIKRMNDQHRMDKLTKSKQRLATKRGIHDRNSVLQYLREPELIENVSGYLQDYKPDLSVHRRMMLEDENDRIADYLNTIEQYGGMGNRSKKTKKRRNRKNRY